MQELLELALKRINALEKRLEKYYSLLKVENELDFIFKGTYVTEDDVQKILEGRN